MEALTVDGPPMPPPLDPAYAAEEPAYVSVAPQNTQYEGAGAGEEGGSNRPKPWQVGGLSLSDVLNASDERESPFSAALESEFGPHGYSPDRKR